MLNEVLEALLPGPHKVFVDGTLGGGSHSEAILEACSPGGRLYGFDRDGEGIGEGDGEGDEEDDDDDDVVEDPAAAAAAAMGESGGS